MALYWKRATTDLRTSVVYKTFWHFAVARQEILAKRLRGAPPPWTSDQILMRYRFTNAYRATDRVSQYLIKNVIYRGDEDSENTFFRTVLFKFFNRIETWQLFVDAGLDLRWRRFDWQRAADLLKAEIDGRRVIYSGAYIIPPGPSSNGSAKHDSHFAIIKGMLDDSAYRGVLGCASMQAAYRLLRTFPLMGPFLAYQLVTDLNYSRYANYDEMEFVIAGPGARSGVEKCFPQRGALSHEDIIRHVTDSQEREFEGRGLKFLSLWGRPLQLIDVQNLFCEVDKYARVKHPNVNSTGGRQRMKRRFIPTSNNVNLWFPPKWGLNHQIKERPYL
jgi:hypothetical protein